MDYRAIITISHRLGEDAQGVAVYETHDYYGFCDPITKQRTYTVDGVQMTATTFYAIPAAITVAPGDTIEVDGESRIVLAVTPVKHPTSRLLVHTEVIGGQ